MDKSRLAVLLLCLFGFLKEFRPSEPFLSPYLISVKNFTEQQITEKIFPVGTYSNMSLLIIIFLSTDWFLYKPILILQGLSGIITWSLLLWTHKLIFIQLAEVTYGLFCACDVAYNAYLYATIEKDSYQKATAQTKASFLISKAFSGLLAQIFISYKISNFLELHYYTIIALYLATIVSICLPRVTKSLYFHKDVENNLNELDNVESNKFLKSGLQKNNFLEVFITMYQAWRKALNNPHTLKWSIWWIMSLCGYLQVTYYIQVLWQRIIDSQSLHETDIYHGYNNAVSSLVGALCTYAVGFVKLDWTVYGEPLLAALAALQSGILFYISVFEQNLIMHYVWHGLFKILYQTSNTISAWEIAKSLTSETYGLVFGINQFFALVEQSLMTMLVSQVFHLPIQSQFLVYGGYFGLIATGFFTAAIYTCCKRKNIN